MYKVIPKYADHILARLSWINQFHHKNTISPCLWCSNLAKIEGTLDVGKFSLIEFGFYFGISLRQMTCNGEVVVKYSSASFPHPVMIFGRDVLILIKDNTLLRSFRIVTYMFFVPCNKCRWTADTWPDNEIEEL